MVTELLPTASADQLIAVYCIPSLMTWDGHIFSFFLFLHISLPSSASSVGHLFSLSVVHRQQQRSAFRSQLVTLGADFFLFFLSFSIGFAIYWQLIKQIHSIHLIALHPRHARNREQTGSSSGLHCRTLLVQLLPPSSLPDFSGSVSCLLLLFPLLYCFRQDYQ